MEEQFAVKGKLKSYSIVNVIEIDSTCHLTWMLAFVHFSMSSFCSCFFPSSSGAKHSFLFLYRVTVPKLRIAPYM